MFHVKHPFFCVPVEAHPPGERRRKPKCALPEAQNSCESEAGVSCGAGVFTRVIAARKEMGEGRGFRTPGEERFGALAIAAPLLLHEFYDVFYAAVEEEAEGVDRVGGD